MINVTELRVGNIVLYTQDNDELPVLKIDGDSKTICLDLLLDLNMEVNEQDIEPIPLTPEWLGRCGFLSAGQFDKDIYKVVVNGESYYIRDHKGFDFAIDSNEGDPLYIRYDLHHVHQLQNLYFALTGEELAIKL